MKKFSAVIYKLGINPVVDPPEEILKGLFDKAGRSRGPIPVRGRLNGTEFVQTLVKYAGAWRLYINGQMLERSGVKVGETAVIEIEFDSRPRDVPVPAAFAKALRQNAGAQQAFNDLTPSRQKEVLRYLGSLKTEASLDRNVAKVLADLMGGETEASHITLRKRGRDAKAKK